MPRSRLTSAKKRSKDVLYRIAPARLYLALYARDTDHRVAQNPSRAAGHPEASVAPKVMRYVIHLGLRPHHRLLDFGCGVLRTGKHLISYLDAEGYVGVDISSGAIAYAQRLIEESDWGREKIPAVWRVAPYEPLRLPWVPDFVLCHSVFTHLTPPAAARTFAQLRDVMGPHTTIALTAFCGDRYLQKTYKDIQYQSEQVIHLASDAGIDLQTLEGKWGFSHTIFYGQVK